MPLAHLELSPRCYKWAKLPDVHQFYHPHQGASLVPTYFHTILGLPGRETSPYASICSKVTSPILLGPPHGCLCLVTSTPWLSLPPSHELLDNRQWVFFIILSIPTHTHISSILPSAEYQVLDKKKQGAHIPLALNRLAMAMSLHRDSWGGWCAQDKGRWTPCSDLPRACPRPRLPRHSSPGARSNRWQAPTRL